MDTDSATGKVLDADRLGILEGLEDDLVDVRNLLCQLSDRLRDAERRLDFAFAPPALAAREERPEVRTPNKWRRLIERLTKEAMVHKPIEKELRKLPVKGGLLPIARELGLTDARLSPKAELVVWIANHIRQKAIVRGGGFTAWLQRAGQQGR